MRSIASASSVPSPLAAKAAAVAVASFLYGTRLWYAVSMPARLARSRPKAALRLETTRTMRALGMTGGGRFGSCEGTEAAAAAGEEEVMVVVVTGGRASMMAWRFVPEPWGG